MITFLLTSLLGVMLLGIPILISIALIGFVGDDASGLGRATVRELGHRGLVDVDADERDGRGENVARRDRVEHRRHHDREADAVELRPHRPLPLEHVGVDLG
jgi:hypothetical protein